MASNFWPQFEVEVEVDGDTAGPEVMVLLFATLVVVDVTSLRCFMAGVLHCFIVLDCVAVHMFM